MVKNNCIVEFTVDIIENEKKRLPSLLNMFSMFKVRSWYNPGGDDENTVEI